MPRIARYSKREMRECMRALPPPDVTKELKFPLTVSLRSLAFSPRGRCTDEIVKYISNAKKSIFFLAYVFTSKPIAESMIKIANKGTPVQGLLDSVCDEGKYTLLPMLKQGGVQVKVDKKHAIAHNKAIVIDEKYVITGSFNFSFSAEFRNAENCLILASKALAATYIKYWHQHAEHSVEPTIGTRSFKRKAKPRETPAMQI